MLDAWVLTRYNDVAAALEAPALSSANLAHEREAHQALRQAARQTLSRDHIPTWHGLIEESAQHWAAQLPRNTGIDLVQSFATPWALSVAILVSGAAEAESARLAQLARRIFLAAAYETGDAVPAGALEATADLARALSSTAHFTSAPPAAAFEIVHSLSSAAPSIAVQAFVALSQTLPCFLAGACLALLQHAEEAARLRADRTLMPAAVDELLRFAGPARAVFRHARSELALGGITISAGERVVLMLSSANRDGTRFHDPERLILDRNGAGVLAFGRGPHHCPGAALIRAIAGIAINTLLALPVTIELAGPVEWMDGLAIRGPTALPVVLHS